MGEHRFEVRPVPRYDGARYPGLRAPEPPGEEAGERRSPLALACALLLVAGLVVGLVGCYMRTDYRPDDPRPETPDGGPDPDCGPGALRCASPLVLEACEDGAWVAGACHDRCVEALGPFAFSNGCDAAAADPCLCEYDVIDGGAPECTPGELYCSDARTLVACEGGGIVARDCDELCRADRGEEWASAGCDETAADPCLCFYDVLDGFMPSCDPGETYCVDAATLAVCGDEGYVLRACDELCVEAHGEGWASAGCEDGAEEPCRCAREQGE